MEDGKKKAKPSLLKIPAGVSYDPPPVIPTPVAGVGRLRKIALIGSAQTVGLAPWYDPSWEIWAHATVNAYCKRADRYFDLHPWEWISTKPVPGYLDWLRTLRTPIYMQRKFRDVPASVRYPQERMLAEWPRYFTNHVAWMVALALSEGVTHLGFYGIHYALEEEHRKQRACCEFWMGVAAGRGVQIVNPPGSPLMREPNWLYGYESHANRKHGREATGGKKPLTNSRPPVDMSLPPQNVAITLLEPAGADGRYTLEQLQAIARTDIEAKPHQLARLQAQLDGSAWADKDTIHGTNE